MEGLRLTHPLGQLVKTTGPTPKTLNVGGKTFTIPANTSIHCNMSALHTDPGYWGPDAMEWNPKRFISTPAGATSNVPFENEVLASDTSSNFLPWAEGQRVCPGKKFSQVETVAALAVMFRSHKVLPQTEGNETPKQAQSRVFQTGLDVDHESKILHEMRDPGSVSLTWSKRSS